MLQIAANSLAILLDQIVIFALLILKSFRTSSYPDFSGCGKSEIIFHDLIISMNIFLLFLIAYINNMSIKRQRKDSWVV